MKQIRKFGMVFLCMLMFLSISVTIKAASTLSISGYDSLSTLKQGQPFIVKGTITSNYKITKVTGYIATSGGTVKYTKTVTPNATSYNVSGLDSAMLFDKLAIGSYVFKIDATDSSGTSKNVLKQSFTVISSTPSTLAITGYGSLSSLKEGQAFIVKGTVSSNFTITKVTGTIATSQGTVKYTKTVTPNATSYNVAGLDSAMLFDKLSAGNYVFKIDASDSSGTSKNLLTQSFTVVSSNPSTLAIAGYSSLSSLRVGQAFCVQGMISSNYTITKVTGTIATSQGTVKYTKTVAPNAKTYNVAGLDSAMLFNCLAAGNYVFKIDASDDSGTSKNLLCQNFTVTASGSVSNDKQIAMDEAKKRLLSDGYELEFIAGVLANIKHEGTIGIFEYCYADKASEPAYLQYMEDHFDYRTRFSGKRIFDVGINAARELQKAAEDSGFAGKFGLGMIQWTGSRTTGLINSYARYASSDIPTQQEAILAEVNYMADELKGSHSYVYTNWKNGTRSAYEAGRIVCKQYEVPADTENQARIRGNDAAAIYQEWLN
ncbi:MAG: Ig-like domain repeat protein [Clostridium sp.]|nr:Ig-like domain repeat protein [Clostridium sp.]